MSKGIPLYPDKATFKLMASKIEVIQGNITSAAQLLDAIKLNQIYDPFSFLAKARITGGSD
ncbi:MAG: TTC39/IML2 family protein [Pseudomonadales bacterium]|nr:TTC39/IML2 family protein [Pseudomonadales bacterium]